MENCINSPGLNHIVINILQYLPLDDLSSCRLVNKQMLYLVDLVETQLRKNGGYWLKFAKEKYKSMKKELEVLEKRIWKQDVLVPSDPKYKELKNALAILKNFIESDTKTTIENYETPKCNG